MRLDNLPKVQDREDVMNMTSLGCTEQADPSAGLAQHKAEREESKAILNKQLTSGSFVKKPKRTQSPELDRVHKRLSSSRKSTGSGQEEQSLLKRDRTCPENSVSKVSVRQNHLEIVCKTIADAANLKNELQKKHPKQRRECSLTVSIHI